MKNKTGTETPKKFSQLNKVFAPLFAKSWLRTGEDDVSDKKQLQTSLSSYLIIIATYFQVWRRSNSGAVRKRSNLAGYLLFHTYSYPQAQTSPGTGPLK